MCWGITEGMEIVLRVGVKVLLRDSQGRFLVLKRAAAYLGFEGMWDIPGGRIEVGTTLLENLAREVSEETGLVLSGVPTLLAAQDLMKTKGIHTVRLTYLAEGEGEVVLDPQEHTDFRWLSVEEMLGLERMDDKIVEVVRDKLTRQGKMVGL